MNRSRSFATERVSVTSWLLTTDHKRIGVLFFVTTAMALALGGAFALLLRIEHLTPGPTFVSAQSYNRLFTVHGVVMVWLFMIPAIPGAIGNFIVPLQIGARDVAFPRLNLASFYVYLTGAVVVLGSLVAGAIDTGWTFYAPYASKSPTAVLAAVTGVFIIGWSSILTGINFIATIHTMRARGIGWMRVPLFTWAIYGTSLIQVLATPVLAVALALIGLDNGFDWGLFDPARGGDPLLFQHLFWFYSHPAVYIMILPAMGVVSEVVTTCAHKNPLSYRAIVYSTLGIAFVGFLTWGHHMFVAGMSVFDAAAFGILSMLVAVFSAIKVFTWVGTLRSGSISLQAPMLYVLSFLFLFMFGGMTGVAVATMSLDVHWHDTYFVVAHFHFVMVGATLTGYLAAIHYWFPKVTGRVYSERWAIVAWSLVFFGFVLTFTPQFLLGNGGMPRRYFNYAPEFQALHVLSTVGAFGLGFGLLLTPGYLVVALFGPRSRSGNPWHSRCFEWRTPSPPPRENFHSEPSYEIGAYDYHEPTAEGA